MDIGNIVSTIGVGGALVWYLWYTTSVAQPKRDEHYSKVLTEITSNFTQSLQEERVFRRQETAELKQLLRETRCRYNADHQFSNGSGQQEHDEGR